MSALRDFSEVQRAHDVLAALLEGAIDLGLDPEDYPLAKAACDVLCWVLLHDNNVEFKANLDRLYLEMKRRRVKEYIKT